MSFSIAEIAAALGAEAVGDLAWRIDRPKEPVAAGPRDLALAMDKTFADGISLGKARAAILWLGADWQGLGLRAAIFAPRSRYVMAGVTRVFELRPLVEPGIHPSAAIHPTAKIGDGASIGAFVVIGAGVQIHENCTVLSHVSIAENVVIGKGALIHSGVRIGARVQIGQNFIAQANAVIGSDGFSFVTPQPGALEEMKATGQITAASQTEGFARINSLGSVVIGNDVEAGAGSTIDRGTIANTVIGDGTKIDNLVQIGHNVRVGKACLLCAQVGIAGSSVIGDRVILGGQVGVADHVNIGSDVIAAGKSGISSHVPSNRMVMGNPAVKMETNIESYKALRRLPRLVAKVDEIQRRLQKGEPKP